MLDVITAGETMVAMVPRERGSLRYAQSFGMRIAGAESNVAIGIAKMGHRSGWISKLGEDEFGEYILREIRGEGVDTSRVIRSAQHPTAVMFKQFGPGEETSVSYYRHCSAASTLEPADIDEEYISNARIVYLTGVTPALSASCRAVTQHISGLARKAGRLLSFDPNVRLKLWDADSAREALHPFLLSSDIVMLGKGEGELLLGTADPAGIITALRNGGVRYIAVKAGAEGAVVADRDTIAEIPAVKVAGVVDNIGAGDAFNVGFLCGILEGADIRTCGEMGALLGAFAVTVQGDIEGISDRRQFESLRRKAAVVYR